MAGTRRALVVGLLAAALAPWEARAGPLTAREEAGKRIFLRGESPSGAGISATIGGDVVLPGSQAPCASCHGADGLGREEGGADSGSITWTNLTKRYGHVHADGRRHPPFDAASLGRAIRLGVDPAGNALAPAMPRFSISTEDLGALVAYLRRLERDFDPGVLERTVRIGTILPDRGRLAPLGQAIRVVLERSLRGLDATGGVHGRRIELVVAGYGDAREAAAALDRLTAQREPFALVAPFAPGAEEAIEAAARRRELPVIGPITPFGRVADPPDPGLFFVEGGLAEEVRALARWAGRAGRGAGGRVAIVAPGGGAGGWAAEEARRGLGGSGQGAPIEIPVASPPAESVRRLRAERVAIVLFLGSGDELAAFGAACASAGFSPELLAPATFAARAAVGLPPSAARAIHVAFATIPSDVTEAGRRRLEAAGGSLRPENAARTAQLAALQASEVLLEGLRRAGRHLTRERLIEALEGIYRLETGVGPPITFGPARRVGASGAWVVEALPRSRTYGSVEWVKLD